MSMRIRRIREAVRDVDDHDLRAYNGTGPAGVFSRTGNVHRLSLLANRRINHAIGGRGQPGPAPAHRRPGLLLLQDSRGKTRNQAFRSLKRKVSDAVYASRLTPGRPPRRPAGPGRAPGNDSDSSAAGSHPERQLFGQATPGPGTTIRSAPRPRTTPPKPTSKRTLPAA